MQLNSTVSCRTVCLQKVCSKQSVSSLQYNRNALITNNVQDKFLNINYYFNLSKQTMCIRFCFLQVQMFKFAPK